MVSQAVMPDEVSPVVEFASGSSPHGYRVDFSACNILVVDDSFLSRELIETCLKDAGYANILLAEDGQQAMDRLDGFNPDLVILDLVMPVLDGYAVCEQLRARADTRNVPILVQSGHDKPEDIKRAFEAGASDMIGKPFRRVELLSRVRVHLENRFLVKDLLSFRKRIAQELDDAREMQQILCPADDLIADVARRYALDIGCCYQPSSELGGDIWGMFETDDERVCIYLADFAGHGVAAALNTFRLHTLVARLRDDVPDPAQVLSSLNESLNDILRPGQFCTMIWTCIDRNGTLTYASAGAPPPIVWPSDMPHEPRQGPGMGLPLGFVSGASYTNHELDFRDGSRFLFYSDAIIEAESERCPPFGEDGMLQLLKETAGADCQDFLDRFLAKFHRRLGELPMDDLTAVLIGAANPDRERDGGAS